MFGVEVFIGCQKIIIFFVVDIQTAIRTYPKSVF